MKCPAIEMRIRKVLRMFAYCGPVTAMLAPILNTFWGEIPNWAIAKVRSVLVYVAQ